MYNSQIISETPKVYTPSSIDVDEIKKKYYGEKIIDFADVLSSNFSREYLFTLYDKLNSLEIIYKKEKEEKEPNVIYDFIKNKITLHDHVDEEAFYQILLSVNSIFRNAFIYCGFGQISYENASRIGNGINHGYQSIMLERYFKEKNTNINGKYYIYQKYITDKVEKIIGQEEMEILFLNNDLKGLINKLKVYANEEEIIDFLNNIDYVDTILESEQINFTSKFLMKNSIQKINYFLSKAYAYKFFIDNMNKDTNIDEFITYLSEYISSLCINYNLLGCKVISSNAKSIKKIANKLINELINNGLLISEKTRKRK